MKVEELEGEVTTAIPLAERLGLTRHRTRELPHYMRLWLEPCHVAVQVQNDRDCTKGTN